MALVQDFQIISSRETFIGDGRVNDKEEVEFDFRLADISERHAAILQFEVQGLTVANENPDVEINNRKVGEIDRHFLRSKGTDGEMRFWMPQSMIIPGGRLRNGTNTLEITAPGWKHSHDRDRYDDFRIRNIVLYYRTSISARTLSTA